MHRDPIEDNPYSQKNLTFDRNNNYLFLNKLKTNFLPLYSLDNIDDLYHNFTKTLSYSINKFSIEVSSNKINRKTTHGMTDIVKVRGDKLRKMLMNLSKLTR